MRLLCALVFALLAILPRTNAASFPDYNTSSFVPTVKVKNGTYSGVYLSNFDQDIFLDIPYSCPPTAPHRFLPARPLNSTWSGIRNATNYGHTCPSADAGDLSLPYGMSEDCLFLNIIRPSKIEKDKKLNILFWIHGGSYQTGASSLPNYNLTYIVNRSVEMVTPIIGVSVNYRKGPWGLMYGDAVKAEGNENLAIKDIMLALRWVKENIEFFGGNPKKITIQGESSGSFMVGQLVVAEAGKGEQLFHQAVQESGSASTGTYNGTDWYEPKFQALLNNTGCDSISCLRGIPYEAIYPAMNGSISGSWYPVVDPHILPEHPAKLLSTGQYRPIPILQGVNTDEGTDNAIFGLNSELEHTQHLTTVGNPVMTPSTVSSLLKIYPFVNLSISSDYGIPYDTPISASALGINLGAQYKREAAIVGDLYYHGTLLHDASLYASRAPNYVYRFDTLPWNFTTGTNEPWSVIQPSGNVSIKALTNSYKGVEHFTETAFVFDNPAYYGPDIDYKELAKQMSGFWINFVNFGEPTPDGTVRWEKYGERKGGNFTGDVSNLLIMRTKSRGGCVPGLNDWRLEGRGFLVKTMKEVYGE